MDQKLRYYVIGPFQFLLFSLFTSEFLLGYWMLFIAQDYYERIVAGSLSITVLIAVLVIFCVIYYIKKNHGDFKEWKNDTRCKL